MNAAVPGGKAWRPRHVVVILAAAAINLGLFSLAELLTAERTPVLDITVPVPVALVALPPPEQAPPPERAAPPEPEPKPRLDFRPSLALPAPGAVPPGAVVIDVRPDFSGAAFDPGALVFESADLDAPPRAVARTAPPFPYRARQRNVSGSVTVKLRVEKDGSVGGIEILEAQPQGYFEEAVLGTVPTWRFQPGVIAGEPVASWVVTTIQFELPDSR